MLKPRYIMVGGFLGAGKTTAILKLAEQLAAAGERVGLITNDQSVGLVDTAMLGAHGFATEEITGGCFCCRFGSLVEAAEKLTSQTRPSVFLAEPVGSCTDLRATVSYPLAQMYGDNFTITPLSVLLDPIRAQRILGLQPGKNFSQKVTYIYEKQLEEADLIVVNKIDLLSESGLAELVSALEDRWPAARVLRVCARTGEGLDAWLDAISAGELASRTSMDVDYDVYAEGEALLGWLNVQADVSGEEFDGNVWLRTLADRLRERLDAAGIDLAHLKMTLTPAVGNDLAVVNVVRDGTGAEMSHELAEPVEQAELLLNLRAEGAPEQLKEMAVELLQSAAAQDQLQLEIGHAEAFRPGRPTPTHRVSS